MLLCTACCSRPLGLTQKLLENEQTSAKTLERQLTQEREALRQVRDASHGKVDSSQLQEALVRATGMQQARTGLPCLEATLMWCLPWQHVLQLFSTNCSFHSEPVCQDDKKLSETFRFHTSRLIKSASSFTSQPLLHGVTLHSRANCPSARKDVLAVSACTQSCRYERPYSFLELLRDMLHATLLLAQLSSHAAVHDMKLVRLQEKCPASPDMSCMALLTPVSLAAGA